MKHIKKHSYLCLCILLSASLFWSGCTGERHATATELILGTIIHAEIYGRASQEELDTALAAALDRARELEQVFSVNKEDSELSYVNLNAVAAPVPISEDLYTVIEAALSFARFTQGAFDPTLGRLIQLWGIGTDHAAVPAPEAIDAQKNKHNYENIRLDEKEHTIFFTTDDFSLDLGAIAKGYVADEMKTLLMEEYDITSGLLNLGGNIITIGSKPGGQPWTIGIADPANPQATDRPAFLLKVSDQTLVTSGDYQRYYEAEDGRRYHHILDSATGYPADSGTASVSIITDNSMTADALSTAAFVLPREEALALIETLEGVEAVFIDANGNAAATSGLLGQLHEGSLKLP